MSQPAPRGFNALDALAANLAAERLASYLGDKSVGDLRRMVALDVDLAAELPMQVSIPNFGLPKAALAGYLRGASVPLSEAIRQRLGARLPKIAAALGFPEAFPWYCRTMDRVRLRLIQDLEAKPDAIVEER